MGVARVRQTGVSLRGAFRGSIALWLGVSGLFAAPSHAAPSGAASSAGRAVGASSGEVGASSAVTLSDRILSEGLTSLGRGRIFSKGYETFIYATPDKTKHQIGYVRVGHSVRLRPDADGQVRPQRGPACAGGYYPVMPRGFVCLDRSATLSPEGRYTSAMSGLVPSTEPLPYGYALSNGTPMYRRLPTRAEWEREERHLGAPGTHGPLSWGNKGHEVLAVKELPQVTGELPWFLDAGGAAGSAAPLGLVRRSIPLGSMLAYSRVFEHEGRRFLLSADGTVVPADRTRPFREVSFEGVELGGERSLPLGWFRQEGAARYRVSGSAGALEATRDGGFPRLGHVRLDPSASAEPIGGRRLLRTLERAPSGEPWWVDEAEVTRVDRREKLPWGITGADKWIWISLTRGTLVAYEGERPVFATLQSPGVGGVPVRGRDPVKHSTTPMGIYRVTYKHRAATMSPEFGEDRSFWIADVPYTQYFDAPFAIHVAYWHDRFGQGMSAGCVNVSPRDGKRLFEFTAPHVPEDWNGALAGAANGRGTFIVIER